MFRDFLIAAAMFIAGPGFVSGQDIFWSFNPTELETDSPNDFLVGNSGSVYIFSDGLLGFDALDLDFSTSDQAVIWFAGGEAFNPTFNTVGGERFDSSAITINGEGASGNLLLLNTTQNGVDPALGPLFDPGFVAGVGPNGAVLLARIDFCLLYTSPSPRDQRGSRMPSSA